MIKWFGDRARAVVMARASRAVGRAADYLAERAIAHAPEDSGDLKESIVVIPDPMKPRVFVGVDYADPVHNGHLAGSTWVAANPFLWRAYEDTRRRWPALVREVRISSGFTRSASIDSGGNLVDTSSGSGTMTATF